MTPSEEMINTFMASLFQDMEGTITALDERVEELHEAVKKRDYPRCIEISAEIIALCGSIMPLQNLKEGIELALNKDNLQ